MKKLIRFLVLGLAMSLTSCYDDSALWDFVKDHETRIAKLETLCSQMNTNITSLQAILDAMQDNDYVTEVAPVTQEGKVIGYTISFAKSAPITIFHGKDGRDGEDGKDGTNGTDGKDGAVMLTYYSEEDDSENKMVELEIQGIAKKSKAEVYLLDENNDLKLISYQYFTTDKFALILDMKIHNSYMIKVVEI